MLDDDRAVSVTVGYTLNFAIAAVLFSALLIAGSGLIDSQTRTVTHDELSVTGQQLAEELMAADRLVRAGGSSDSVVLSVETTLPERAAAGGYTMRIEHADGNGAIDLETTDPNVEVTVPFRSQTDIQNTTVGGGTVGIEYDNGALVVDSE